MNKRPGSESPPPVSPSENFEHLDVPPVRLLRRFKKQTKYPHNRSDALHPWRARQKERKLRASQP